MEMQNMALTWYSREISNALYESWRMIYIASLVTPLLKLLCIGRFIVIAKAAAPQMAILPEKVAECLSWDS